MVAVMPGRTEKDGRARKSPQVGLAEGSAVSRRGNRKLREVKRKLHELKDEVAQNTDTYLKQGDKTLLLALGKSQRGFQRIVDNKGSTNEASIESSILKNLANTSRKRAEALRIGRTYTLDSFCDALRKKTNTPRGSDPSAVARLGTECFRQRAPAPMFLLGPVSYHKERVQRERQVRQREDVGRVQKASKLELDTKAEESVTTQRIVEVEKVLQKQNEIDFYELVADPKSFSQTVENIFHFSFLVKEGTAGLQASEDGRLVARATQPPSEEASTQQGKTDRQQCILTIDYKTYQQALEQKHLQNKDSVIPHRDYSDLIREALDNAGADDDADPDGDVDM
eukprot:CAMPEP_0119159124 /NCGR_PEP_ID=MMETSP1310-20130426/53606_1 /TAXON_ID=464262 /ORGANISM="Genus nov. species nov., Strain RCC2339" /LENGTH=339 /DNA_ID=CAMNT_0007151753 /DNA_START=57 /DNA_END=1076 /DNA_ORIENTATION=+